MEWGHILKARKVRAEEQIVLDKCSLACFFKGPDYVALQLLRTRRAVAVETVLPFLTVWTIELVFLNLYR